MQELGDCLRQGILASKIKGGIMGVKSEDCLLVTQ